MFVYNFYGIYSTAYFKPESPRTFHSYSYDFLLNGSKLVLILPLNRKGVCGITDILCLRVCKPIFNASTLSILYIEPYSGSTIRNKA